MGKIVGINCSKCGYGIEAHEGIGFTYHPSSIFNPGWSGKLKIYSLTQEERIASELLQINKRYHGNFGDWGTARYGKDVTACSNCQRLVVHFLFEYHYTDEDGLEKIYTPEYKCKFCGGKIAPLKITELPGDSEKKYREDYFAKMELEEESSKEWHCPECNNDEVKISDLGFWD